MKKSELKKQIEKLREKNETLKEEVSELQEEIQELESIEKYELPKHLSTLRITSAINDVIDNIERIPVNELEEFVNKFKL